MGKIEELIKQLCPDGVKFVKLGDFFDMFKGMSKVSKKWADTGNCKFIDYLNIYNNMTVDVTKLQNATVATFKQNNLKEGDILFTCASETPYECAISAVIREPIAENTFLDDHLNGIRVKREFEEIVLPAFINYYFYSVAFRKSICKIVRGVTRFYIVNRSFLNIMIPLPPLAVQKEIVEILDTFTGMIDNLQKELEQRQKQFEYYRSKFFAYNEDECDWFSLPMISENCDRKRKPIKGSKREKGIYPYYGASGIVDYVKDYILDGEYLLISEDGANLVARNTPIAFSIEGKNWVNNHAHVVKFNSLNDQRFVEYYFNSIDLTPWISGGAQPKLNQENLNKILIPYPSVERRNIIVDTLKSFEALISNIKQEIELRQKQYKYYREKLLTFE